MADYHIYLHSDQASSISDNTKPKEESMGGVFSAIQSGISKAQQFATSGFGSMINSGIASLGKAVPQIALAYFVAKGIDKVVSTGFGHLESFTGHYEYSMGYNNFKTLTGMVVNPIGTALKQANIIAEQNKINKRQEQVRSLIGQTTKIGV